MIGQALKISGRYFQAWWTANAKKPKQWHVWAHSGQNEVANVSWSGTYQELDLDNEDLLASSNELLSLLKFNNFHEK